MTKKTDYRLCADELARMVKTARGAPRRDLLEREAACRRMQRACFESDFGPAPGEQALGHASVRAL
jgi:hypothetical protein